jgi:integrase
LAEKEKSLGDWRIHDLRRTASTNLGDMGYLDEEIGMLLNHHTRGVTAVYNRSKYINKKRQMLEKWERKLLSSVL